LLEYRLLTLAPDLGSALLDEVERTSIDLSMVGMKDMVTVLLSNTESK
jgi:hypothetical protein